MSQQNISFSDKQVELPIEAPELAPIITYPRFTSDEYTARIDEMKSHGITSVLPGRGTTVNGIRIAGKGCVGLVLKARIGGRVCALKIRRIDADRKSMHEEARLHSIANLAGVGPRLEGHSDNFIVMEFIDGPSLIDWLGGSVAKDEVRKVARSVLEICYRLDRTGLDHGELSRLDRHIIVSDSASLIDFESASIARKTCNVTAAAQAVFVAGAVAGRIGKILGLPDRDRIIGALRVYKRDQTRANFDALLGILPI